MELKQGITLENYKILAIIIICKSGFDIRRLTFEFKVTDLISMQPKINYTIYTQRGVVHTRLQPVGKNELSEQLNMYYLF